MACGLSHRTELLSHSFPGRSTNVRVSIAVLATQKDACDLPIPRFARAPQRPYRMPILVRLKIYPRDKPFGGVRIACCKSGCKSKSHTKPRLQARLKGDRRRPASVN
jgi:hypothetical protein